MLLVRLGTYGITTPPLFTYGEGLFFLDEPEGNGSTLSEVHIESDLTNLLTIHRLAADGDRPIHTLQLEVYSTMKTFVATAID